MVAGKVARLQGVPGGGTNVNVNCITKHTDIFFSLGQHFDSYLTSCSARKEMLVIETQFCCALRMCVCVCVNIVPLHAIKVYGGVAA